MKIRTNYLEIDKKILGADKFLLIGMEDYKEYDRVSKKYTDKIIGTKYTVVIHNPEKGIKYEKLEVKILGVCNIPSYKNGDELPCRFSGLVLTPSNIEYGMAEIKATADKIEFKIINSSK